LDQDRATRIPKGILFWVVLGDPVPLEDPLDAKGDSSRPVSTGLCSWRVWYFWCFIFQKVRPPSFKFV
jgi:hypothetical protein